MSVHREVTPAGDVEQGALESGATITLYRRRYRVVRQISRKPTSSVYLAKQLSLERDVVLKLVFSEDDTNTERFRREAQALSLFRHPNNIRIYDAGAGRFAGHQGSCLITEFVRGLSLRELLNETRRLGLTRSIHIVRQVLLGLSEAHRLQVIHRDVKPENIMVSTHDGRRDHVTVIDYGIATTARSTSTAAGTLRPAGTPGYMAPEVLSGHAPHVESDLYGVGAVLYECLTGAPPARTGRGAGGPEVPPVHELVPCPASLSQVVSRSLAVNPAARYASAADFVEALDAVEASELLEFELPGAAQLESERVELQRMATLESLEDGAAASRGALSDAFLSLSSHTPTVWVLTGDPGINEDLLGVIRMACLKTDLITLGPEERATWCQRLLDQEVPEPWLVVFGDMHVILQDDLLYSLAERGETTKLLISTHLNAELLQEATNFSGIDHHFTHPIERVALTQAVQDLLSRSRHMRRRYDQLRTELLATKRELARARAGAPAIPGDTLED